MADSTTQVGGWREPMAEHFPDRTEEERAKLRGERIRKRRELRELSVAAAATVIGVDATDWQAFEDGSGEPSFREGMAMAVLFDVEATWLAGLA